MKSPLDSKPSPSKQHRQGAPPAEQPHRNPWPGSGGGLNPNQLTSVDVKRSFFRGFSASRYIKYGYNISIYIYQIIIDANVVDLWIFCQSEPLLLETRHGCFFDLRQIDHIRLAVNLPLWKIWKSVGNMKFQTEWKVIKLHGSKPPTRWLFTII